MATSVTITTNEGSTEYTVSTGARGPAGAPGPGTNVTVSTTPPANPDEGDKWVDSETMVESVWYDDGTDGGVWVQTSGDTANAISTDLAPVAVADSAERKLAATYTALDITPVNGLRVIQDDLPDVVWTLLDVSDITADANWAGSPRTNASGQLPLSGVKLADGNNPFSFVRYIPASSPDWFTSNSQKYIRLYSGITIPASLMVAGNKVAISGTYRVRRDSTGLGTGIFLTFQQASLFDFIEANPTTTQDSTVPVVDIANATTILEHQGIFNAIFTLTAVTGAASELRLVANTDLTDGGKFWDFTNSVYEALGNPTADAVNSAGLETNIPAGEDWDVVIALQGGANAPNKIHQISMTGGINVWAP